jgi:TLC domain
MRDPFPFSGPGALSNVIRPLSDYLGLTTLSIHIHEIIFGFVLYEAIFRVFSPLLSRLLAPKRYSSLDRRGRLNWDAHAVSMAQCLLINGLALWVIFADLGRGVLSKDWKERLWGYNGAGGMVQGLAAGYFAWDAYVSCIHLDVMGMSSLMHAIAALVVTCIGFVSCYRFYFSGIP